jgi:flavin-dependent dehydrogenase
VRKAIGLSAGTLRAQVLELDTEPVEGERPRDVLHFDAADRALTGYAWDFPTIVGGRAMVCRGVYKLKVGEGGPDVQEALAARLRAMGLDIDAYKNKRFAERGFVPRDRVASKALMLVGEAAGIDPVTGEGIAQAIEYGALAGKYLAGHLSAPGWQDVFERSRLARDLRIRHRFVDLFYGAPREEVERFILDSPDTLWVGCQHFAAEPYDWLRLSGVVARGAAHVVSGALSRVLR